MAKEQPPQAQQFQKYQTEGRKTVRFMNDDMAAQRVEVYEGLGYTIDRVEHNHIILSTPDEQAEANRLAAIALHKRQVKPSIQNVPGEGVKPMELIDERRSTPDMAPPTLNEL